LLSVLTGNAARFIFCSAFVQYGINIGCGEGLMVKDLREV
jgi:hypothetical protein